jgi:hypothetical protein
MGRRFLRTIRFPSTPFTSVPIVTRFFVRTEDTNHPSHRASFSLTTSHSHIPTQHDHDAAKIPIPFFFCGWLSGGDMFHRTTADQDYRNTKEYADNGAQDNLYADYAAINRTNKAAGEFCWRAESQC